MGMQQQSGNTQADTLPTSGPANSRFCYRIGSYTVLMEADVVAEVLLRQSVYQLPFAPEWCAGLTSLRGELYPVVDMHRVLLGQGSPAHHQLLLVRHPGFPPVILTCDGYPRQLKLATESVHEQAGVRLPGWISHTLQHQGELLLAADHGKLLRHIQRTSRQI